MSTEKQIEGIKSVLLRMNACEMYDEIKCVHDCDECIATQIYNAGYRSQSGVIKEFVEKIHSELRIYGRDDKFDKAKFLDIVNGIVEKMKGGE